MKTAKTPKTLKTPQSLEDTGLIPAAERSLLDEVSRRYSVSVTDQVRATIARPSMDDPVFRQYIPDARELALSPDDLRDPIGDDVHEVTKGLVHRYPDRVLYKITPTCAVYCRFCFRREMVGRGKDALSDADHQAVFDYIAAHPQIREVILSGGDPLVLSPRRLHAVMESLAAMDHIKLVRLHTRTPVAAPDLVDDAMIDALAPFVHPQGRLRLNTVIHVNHAQELNAAALNAVARFQNIGAVMSQSVLLRGVNDSVAALSDLFTKLVEHGVQPYYLHHPDKAPGTAHFRVTIAEGRALYNALRGTLSGHALPHYVLDIPGGHGKIPLNADWITPHPEGGYSLRDIHGNTHRYED